MALPPAGPLPPWWPIPLGYVRPAHLLVHRWLLPGLFRPPFRPSCRTHSSSGNKAASCRVKFSNCRAKPSNSRICDCKRVSQAAE